MVIRILKIQSSKKKCKTPIRKSWKIILKIPKERQNPDKRKKVGI